MSKSTKAMPLGTNGILALIAAIGVFGITWQRASAEEAILVKDGVAAGGIVLPDKPEGDETLAAQELRHFVERMSGARTPLGGAQLALMGPDDKGPKSTWAGHRRFLTLQPPSRYPT